MKQNLTFLVPLLFSAMSLFSQNTNPYLIFGYNSEIEYKLPMDKLFRIDNADTVSEMKTIVIDFESSLVYLLGEYDVILDTINLNPDDVLIWLSVDPMSDKYPQHSPYVYCSNNPLRYIDPNGREWVDADGYKITDHSNIKAYIFYDPKSYKVNPRLCINNSNLNMERVLWQ